MFGKTNVHTQNTNVLDSIPQNAPSVVSGRGWQVGTRVGEGLESFSGGGLTTSLLNPPREYPLFSPTVSALPSKKQLFLTCKNFPGLPCLCPQLLHGDLFSKSV